MAIKPETGMHTFPTPSIPPVLTDQGAGTTPVLTAQVRHSFDSASLTVF